MKKTQFDEYQLGIQKQICLQTLIITLAVVVANGCVSTVYTWATPLTQAIMIVFIAALYFSVVAALKGVWLSNEQRNPKKYAIIFFLASFVHFIPMSIIICNKGVTHYFANGMVQESIFAPIGWLYFLLIAIALMVKERKDTKDEGESEYHP